MRPFDYAWKLLDTARFMKELVGNTGLGPAQGKPDQLARKLLAWKSHPNAMRVGFALRSLVTSVVKAQEIVSVSSQLWPQIEKNEGFRQLTKCLELAYFVPGLGEPKTLAFVLQVVEAFNKLEAPDYAPEAGADESLEQRSYSTTEDWYYALCRYRDARVVASFAHREGNSGQFFVRCDLPRTPVYPEEAAELQRMLRAYRMTNLLLSWVRYPNASDGPADRYPELFKGVLPATKGLTSAVIGNRLADADIPLDVRPAVESIVARLQTAVREVGYGALTRMVKSHGGQEGPNSMLGNPDEVNVAVLSEVPQLAPVVIAMAVQAKRKGALSLEGALRYLNEALDQASGKVRVAVVISDQDSRRFQSACFERLRRHYALGVRFVFLQVGIPRTSLSPIHIDFAGGGDSSD